LRPPLHGHSSAPASIASILAGSYRITSVTVTALFFEVAGITGSP
jgi:hypothetical protein